MQSRVYLSERPREAPVVPVTFSTARFALSSSSGLSQSFAWSISIYDLPEHWRVANSERSGRRGHPWRPRGLAPAPAQAPNARGRGESTTPVPGEIGAARGRHVA